MNTLWRSTSVAALISAAASPGWAQTTVAAAAETPAAAAQDLAEVIVTGTRQAGLKVADSPAPVQVVGAEALAKTGQVDLRLGLAELVPSFTAQAFGGDASNLTLSARLRGLSPNDTLVLVNGKRRHTTANFGVASGAFQGSAAADLNFIAPASISRIEVLTDGAAAQYGTDAIAGVINIILKDKDKGGGVTATGGQYFDGGGDTGDLSVNLGTRPFDGAHLNLTGETKYHGHSLRGLPDQRLVNPASPAYSPALYAYESTLPGFPTLNRIFGDAQYRLSTLTYDAGIDLPQQAEVYSFGTYGHKDASSYENYRRFNRVQGAAGATDRPFPAGFSPLEHIIEDDYGVTLGVKGVVAGWTADLSSTYGLDDIEVRTEHSANRLLYLDTSTLTTPGFTPTSFHDGQWTSSQLTNNLDFRRGFNLGLAAPVDVAVGVEERRETYEIGAGDAASRYKAGAESYPGFSLTDAGRHARTTWAAYTDLALTPVERLKLDAAVRYEHFSDFGDTTIAKLTGRYDFRPEIAIRGTISSGFRAPTLAEEYYSATNVSPTTASVQLAPNSAAARLLGIDKLKPEKADNYSLGLVLHPLPRLTATLDVFEIDIKDRIFGSGFLYGTKGGVSTSPAVQAAILANGNTLDPTVTSTGISIFTNGVDTRTQGADLVISYPTDFGAWGRIDWSLAGNYVTTRVTRVKPTPASLTTPSGPFPNGQTLFTQVSRSLIETASPKYKVGLSGAYALGPVKVNLTETLYGKASAYADPGTGPLQQTPVGQKAITDLELSYTVRRGLTASVGADNLFNTYPTRLSTAYQTAAVASGGAAVGTYPSFSAIGINGGFYYGRLTWTF